MTGFISGRKHNRRIQESCFSEMPADRCGEKLFWHKDDRCHCIRLTLTKVHSFMQFIQIISSFCIINSVKTGSCMSRISPVDQDMADFMRQCKSPPAAFAWVLEKAVKDDGLFRKYDSLFCPLRKTVNALFPSEVKPILSGSLSANFHTGLSAQDTPQQRQYLSVSEEAFRRPHEPVLPLFARFLCWIHIPAS